LGGQDDQRAVTERGLLVKASENLGAITRTKRGQALLVALALAGGLGIGALVSLTVHPRATQAAAQVEISPSTNVIGAPLTRQTTPPLTGLVDQNGKTISLADEKGHVVLLAFMDPLCVNLCPILGRDIVAVEQELPKTVKPVLLIVSVMPDRTPANVASFIKTNLTAQWSPGWHWLLGPTATLEITWLKWGEPLEPPKTNYLDVIDPQGYLRVVYPAPLFVGDVVHAVTTVANE
jgi:cytochrome oxidase Cu insertion factor (SCO1/SenC/PrrC family)